MLRDEFGKDNVFFDTQSIPIGENFDYYIDEVIDSFVEDDVLLALIGQNWLDAADEETGEKKLFREYDIVRHEIERGLETCRVIPVLIEMPRSQIPSQDELPSSIVNLFERNVGEIRRSTLEDDMDRLIEEIGSKPSLVINFGDDVIIPTPSPDPSEYDQMAIHNYSPPGIIVYYEELGGERYRDLLKGVYRTQPIDRWLSGGIYTIFVNIYKGEEIPMSTKKNIQKHESLDQKWEIFQEIIEPYPMYWDTNKLQVKIEPGKTIDLLVSEHIHVSGENNRKYKIKRADSSLFRDLPSSWKR